MDVFIWFSFLLCFVFIGEKGNIGDHIFFQDNSCNSVAALRLLILQVKCQCTRTSREGIVETCTVRSSDRVGDNQPGLHFMLLNFKIIRFNNSLILHCDCDT